MIQSARELIIELLYNLPYDQLTNAQQVCTEFLSCMLVSACILVPVYVVALTIGVITR